MSDATVRQVTPEQALDVLGRLSGELAEVDTDTRAIVGLRAVDDRHVELVDVELKDNGVLEVGPEVTGLVVLTAEELSDDEDVVTVQQLVCVLADGTEVGTSRAGAGPTTDGQAATDGGHEASTWRTDEDPHDAADALRPRDLASNTARRAFGLPSLVDELPAVTGVLARAWLLAVAGEALRRFDDPEGPGDVTPSDLAAVAARPLPGGLPGDGPPPTWRALHHAAVDGHLEVGPFSVDREHARWLDTPGLAQLLDRTLPSTEELLGSLEVVGGDELLGWAIGWLSARDWYQPDDG